VRKKKGEKTCCQEIQCSKGMSRKRGDEGDSDTQKHTPASSSDAVGANKKTSTPRPSDRSVKTKTTNLNLAQGKTVDVLRTATSYLQELETPFLSLLKPIRTFGCIMC
jgi:hypothetical protein